MAVTGNSIGCTLYNRVIYNPPSWIVENLNADIIPKSKINLFNGPTPIHQFRIPGLEDSGLSCFIKRDDLTSFDMSGNKVRKLEFLMADALSPGKSHDSIITIGGLQSNHARATAVASRQLGLDPYLILRTKEQPDDVNVVGNLLFNRMMGADIRLVTPGTYARLGSVALTDQLATELRNKGRNPYIIPVGGSCVLGSFGYLDAVAEIINQGLNFDHLVFACGSGGTAAGLAIGMHLGKHSAKVHAIGVCDSPSYFYNHIDEVAKGLGLLNLDAQKIITIYSGQGIGYARSTTEELEFIMKTSTTTGIILDPVYSGKALYNFISVIQSQPDVFRKGQKILFLHTGGQFGLYDKADQLLPLFKSDLVSKMKVTLPPS